MKRATSLCYFKTVVLRLEHQDPLEGLLKYRFLAPSPVFLVLQVWDGVWGSVFLTSFQVMPIFASSGTTLENHCFDVIPSATKSENLSSCRWKNLSNVFRFFSTWSSLHWTYLLIFFQLSNFSDPKIHIQHFPWACCHLFLSFWVTKTSNLATRMNNPLTTRPFWPCSLVTPHLAAVCACSRWAFSWRGLSPTSLTCHIKYLSSFCWFAVKGMIWLQHLNMFKLCCSVKLSWNGV